MCNCFHCFVQQHCTYCELLINRKTKVVGGNSNCCLWIVMMFCGCGTVFCGVQVAFSEFFVGAICTAMRLRAAKYDTIARLLMCPMTMLAMKTSVEEKKKKKTELFLNLSCGKHCSLRSSSFGVGFIYVTSVCHVAFLYWLHLYSWFMFIMCYFCSTWHHLWGKGGAMQNSVYIPYE